MWEAASRCLIFRSSLDRSKPGGKRDPATSRRFFAAAICSFNVWGLERCRCMRNSLYGESAKVSQSPIATVDGAVIKKS